MNTTVEHPIVQTMRAYHRMATEARYRPAAPSDGFGNITVPLEQLDITEEARRYADRWREEENSCDFFIGCPSYEDRPALVHVIEAARNICGMHPQVAVRLLRMAIEELETIEQQRNNR